MHFRIRGNNVQVVKTVVDKRTLKSTSVPVGSANIRTGVLSERLLSSLNDKEVQETRRWIESRQRIGKLRLEVDAHLLDQRIYEAVEWLKVAPPASTGAVVAEALRAMSAFRRTASKLGLVKEIRGQPGGGKGG